MLKRDAAALIKAIGRATKAFFAPKAELAALADRVARLEGQLKTAGPGLRYRGVFQDGDEYAAGDVVTFRGSMWHAWESTAARPGDNGSAWQLCVKAGRDSR